MRHMHHTPSEAPRDDTAANAARMDTILGNLEKSASEFKGMIEQIFTHKDILLGLGLMTEKDFETLEWHHQWLVTMEGDYRVMRLEV